MKDAAGMLTTILPTIVGREQMQTYIRDAHEYQGVAAVQMGSPLDGGCQVVAEFWATMTKADQPNRSLIGCFIARLDPIGGRCTHFRQYWFVTQGHTTPFMAWGSA